MQTYDELDEQRKAWINEAIDKHAFEDLEKIAYTLGERLTSIKGAGRSAMMYVFGNIRLVVYKDSDTYDPKKGKDIVKTVFKVEVVDAKDCYQVVFYRTVNGEPIAEDKEYLYRYIPGKWEKVLFGQMDKVNAVLGKSEKAKSEEQYQELSKIMLIGKVV